MRLLEIRELDGPNPYLPGPAIKIEYSTGDARPGDERAERFSEACRAWLASNGTRSLQLPEPGAVPGLRGTVAISLIAAIRMGARLVGLPEPAVVAVPGDEPGRIVVAFSWERRGVALALARFAVAVLDELNTGATSGPPAPGALETLRATVAQAPADDDAPESIALGDGPPRVVAITGTNGKTTTTRLVAHILRTAGRRVGWTSTSGVYIEGDQIEDGDWSGPAGARLLLSRDDLDWAILETARGGILRRGLAWDGAHVTALTNVSPDHLGDYGVWTTGTTAAIKGTVIRATRPGGWSVLNADDPLVMKQGDGVDARFCYVTRLPMTGALLARLDAGSTVVAVEDGTIVVRVGSGSEAVARIEDVPVTFGGAAGHMVENSLMATGIALGCGLSPGEIGAGLTTFRGDAASNPGRLNVYGIRGATYLADYAHNEAGLSALIALSRTMLRDDGRLWLIVGTAGDRPDDTFRAIGRMAGEATPLVIPKDAPNYLRGREPGAMQRLIAEGMATAGGRPIATMNDEVAAIDATLPGIRPGDVIAMMAVDDPAAVAARLGELASADQSQ